MVESILENKNKNLILFVHGFTGGKETWLTNSTGKRIPDYLLENKEIRENFDLDYFEYYTKFTDKISKAHWLFTFLPFVKKRKFKKNLYIDDIKDILFSDIDVKFKDYQNIVIIAHSMGGLISKAVILKLIEENRSRISLFISLAVPHNGSNLANMGRLLLSNPNIKDLAPLSKIIDTVNRDWIGIKNKNLIPRTIYFQGKNDNIVPNTSSSGYDPREKGKEYDIIYTNDDHFSILQPENENSTLLISIKNELLSSLKKKHDNQPISDEGIKNLVKKIGEKLELQVPSFNDLILSKDSIPTLSSHISKRQETIKELLQSCNERWLAIYGLFDTGKTQLAILIADFLKLNTYWINCKEVGTHAFIQKILTAFETTNESELFEKIYELKNSSKTLIVLDDLIEFGQNDILDNFFIKFIQECLNSDLHIITTSNYKIHNSIKSIHNDSICEQEVKLLNELETLEIISSYPESNEFEFKSIIHTITKGYPVYTQVICRYLDEKKWKIEEHQLLNFLSGNLFTDLTNETVRKVIKIQDEDTRNLLYRLNVIITDITKKEIKIVADCSPNISNPEEKINSLIGSWVQQLSIINYNVSPLIKRLGTDNIPEKTLLDINFRLGKSILDKGNLSQIDVFNSIMYFFKAEKFEDAGFILMSFLQHIGAKPEYFYKWNFDILWFTTRLPEKMSLQLRLFIRSLHLLLETNRETENDTQKIFLRNDLEALVDEALANKIDVYFPSFILSYSYLREDGKKAIRYFTYYKNSYTYNNLPAEVSSLNADNINKYDDTLIWLLLMEVSDLESLLNWFDNFETSSKAVEDFDKEEVDLISNRLYLNFILKEEKKEQQDWEELLRTFTKIFEKANHLNLEIFKAYSIKKQIQIISEELDDISGAENLFKQYIAYFKEDTAIYLLTDEIGRQLFYKGQTERSLEYLSKIADIKLENYNIVQVDTYSVLAKIFGGKDKNIAQYYSTQALSFAKDNIYVDELWYIKLIGENAISLYLNNKIEDSLKELSRGYELLLNSFENDDAYKNVQLRYGNIISYVNEHFFFGKIPNKSDTHTAPYRGFFENNSNIADLYTDEKRVIIITMLVSFFEEIKDKETAHFWANIAFSLQKEVTIETFRMLFMGLTGYKILEDKYEEAVEEQIKIFDCNKKFVADSKIDVPEYIKNYSIDFAIIASAINPICVRLLHKYILNEIDFEEIGLTIKNLLSKFENNIEDKRLITNILNTLSRFPSTYDESKNLMNTISALESRRFGHVQFLGYILCSMKMNSTVALHTHLIFKDMFKIFSGSINLYIMVPFLVCFWKAKIQEEPSEFKGVRKLEENLDKISSLKGKLQIKAIFALISESLNSKLNQEDHEWLSEYYDEY